MSNLKKFKLNQKKLKNFPLSYNFIKYNNLLIPKSDEFYVIKMEKYSAKTAGHRSTKPISKIVDFTPIQEEIKKANEDNLKA